MPINLLPPASRGKTPPASAKSLLRQPQTFCVGQRNAREGKSNQSRTATASAGELNCTKYRFIRHQCAWLGCGPRWERSCKQRRGSAKRCRKLREAASQHFPWKQQLPGKALNAQYIKTVIPAPSAPLGGFEAPKTWGPCPRHGQAPGWARGVCEPPAPGLPGHVLPFATANDGSDLLRKVVRAAVTWPQGQLGHMPATAPGPCGTGHRSGSQGFFPEQTPTKHDKPLAHPGHFIAISGTHTLSKSTTLTLHLTCFFCISDSTN